MSWSLPIIGLAAALLMFFEIQSVKRRRLEKARQAAWPQFEEIFISALESGISISDSFSYAQEFGLAALQNPMDEIVSKLDRGTPLEQALRDFGRSLNIRFADLFVEIVSLAHRTGGQNLIPSLSEHVESVRFDLSAAGSVESRTSAVIVVGKLGLLAPWVLLLVLCVNERNRASFDSPPGGLLLLGGFAISLLAFRLVVQAGKMKANPRVFGH